MNPSVGLSASYRYPSALLGVFILIFVALGTAPWYRQDWLLENLVLLAALGCLIATRKRVRFSNLAYTPTSWRF